MNANFQRLFVVGVVIGGVLGLALALCAGWLR